MSAPVNPAPVASVSQDNDDTIWNRIQAVEQSVDSKMEHVLCTQCHKLQWWRSMYSVQHEKKTSLSLKNQIWSDEMVEYEQARRMIVETAWCLPCWQTEQAAMMTRNSSNHTE
jgi:hypothetical protein